MSKIDLNELSGIQYDVLKELGNIGAGNATTALAQMLPEIKIANSTICVNIPFHL